MPQGYLKKITIMETECDFTRKISITNLMRHAQQMGSDHLHQVGIGYEQLYKDGMVFVVSKLLVTIHRRPQFNENLILTTVPQKPKRVQFIRDTFFETEDGEKLAEISISWLLVDAKNHKILRPSTFDRYGIEMFPNDGEYITGYKIKRPDGAGERHLRQVKYSDLDYNGHMNNAIYANIVCDLLPIELLESEKIKRFGIHYQKEAKIGQVIELQVVPYADQKGYYISGQAAEAPCFEAEILFG